MVDNTQLVTLTPIKKMDRALGFYTKMLGAKLQMRADGPMKDMWASITLGKSEIWLIVPEKHEKRSLAYTTLVVKDISKTVAAMTKKKVKFEKAVKSSKETKIEGPIAFDQWGASAFFKDSEGNMLMLWQNSDLM